MVTTLRSFARPGRLVRKLRLSQWRETEAGQSLVEFAMILPVFLLLLFALVDFGRGFYTWLVVTNAAREGARAAAVQMDSAGIDQKIQEAYCDDYPGDCSLDPAKMTVTKTNVQGARGSEVTISVSYDFDYVTPIGDFIKLVGGSGLSEPSISASSSMRLE
ncbi:MAG: TadE/TadG family type IV pilus assembly protein [Hyphomicrobiales bacterium]